MRRHRQIIAALALAAASLFGVASTAGATSTTVTKFTQKVGDMRHDCKGSGGVYSASKSLATCLESDGSVTTCTKGGKNNCQNIQASRAPHPGLTDTNVPPVVLG